MDEYTPLKIIFRWYIYVVDYRSTDGKNLIIKYYIYERVLA